VLSNICHVIDTLGNKAAKDLVAMAKITVPRPTTTPAATA
jgi:acyl-CoA dehydrogenase